MTTESSNVQSGSPQGDGQRVVRAAAALTIMLLIAISVVFIPPYLCAWLPAYPSFLDRVEYYWSPTAQFLKCNSILHEIDSAKDAYSLGHDITNLDAALTAAQIGVSSAKLKDPAFMCPSGGRYSINPLGVHPACSIHGDSLDWEDGQPHPTRANPAPPPRSVAPAPRLLRPEDRIEVPPPDEGSGID